MTNETPSIESHDPATEFSAWLQTPPGRYLLDWEQAQLDAAVVNLFGFHALQLGLPQIEGLRANRMPHRWVATSVGPPAEGAQPAPAEGQVGPAGGTVSAVVDLHCHFDALPFPSDSLDLVVLPHALELASDAHQLLREVERVLRPEGRLVIVGLNPMSAWGLRQKLGHGYLPRTGEFLGYWRLRDWLKLLSFEVEAGRFGLYRPPLRSELWLARWQRVEGVGGRWWPVLGAAYFLQAVKRVQGLRLIGLAKQKKLKAKGAPAVALNQNNHRDLHD